MRVMRFLIPLLLLLGAVQARAGTQDFLLFNRTGIEIRELYVSPHDGEDWEEDVLGGNTLPSGSSVQVRFPRRERAEHWDIKIVDDEGESLEWTDLDLSRIAQITLYLRNGEAYAEMR